MADKDTDKKAPAKLYTPAELGQAVVPSTELISLIGADEKPLAEQAAGEIVVARLREIPGLDIIGAATGKNDTALGGDLAWMIVNAIPEKYRTASALAQLDLRPYLAVLNGKTIQDRRFTSNPKGFNDVKYVANTQPYVDGETQRITTQMTNAGDDAGAEAAKTFTTKNAGIVPTPAAVGNDGETLPSGTGTGPDNRPFGLGGLGTDSGQTQIGLNPDGTPILATTSEGSGGQSTFPIADIQGLIDNGTYDLMQAAGREIKEQAVNKTGYFPVDVGMMVTSDDATGKAIGQRHPQTMSINDSMNYINTLSPSKVTDLQHKLAAGGYFDRLQNGGVYDSGNAFDKNTMAAWQLLLTDSIQQKTSAPVVLGRAMNTYRDGVRKERLGAISKYDPRYTRAIANDYGQSKIGRDLTDAEAGMLDRYLQTLVSQRAGYIAGATDNTADGPLTDQRGFTQDDIELGLASNPGFKESERGANNNTFAYKLAQLMH